MLDQADRRSATLVAGPVHGCHYCVRWSNFRAAVTTCCWEGPSDLAYFMHNESNTRWQEWAYKAGGPGTYACGICHPRTNYLVDAQIASNHVITNNGVLFMIVGRLPLADQANLAAANQALRAMVHPVLNGWDREDHGNQCFSDSSDTPWLPTLSPHLPSFPEFGDLPTEIRLVIWEEAVQEDHKDRIILVGSDLLNPSGDLETMEDMIVWSLTSSDREWRIGITGEPDRSDVSAELAGGGPAGPSTRAVNKSNAGRLEQGLVGMSVADPHDHESSPGHRQNVTLSLPRRRGGTRWPTARLTTLGESMHGTTLCSETYSSRGNQRRIPSIPTRMIRDGQPPASSSLYRARNPPAATRETKAGSWKRRPTAYGTLEEEPDVRTGSPSGYRLEQGYRDRSSSAQDVLYTARDTKRDEALWALGYDEGHSECPPGQTGTFEQCYNHEHTLPQEGWLASQGTVVEAVGIASLVLREFGLHWLARKGFPGRIAPPSKFSTHWKFGLDGSRS
ncbi:hypothetical protein PG996_000204 [Apiospora saccharicola]|uniref:Uncharacterized protein n=1 Tax=Apiospora saccharicola TaxID=335842 RepID=A0ABR1WH72_9PEZI